MPRFAMLPGAMMALAAAASLSMIGARNPVRPHTPLRPEPAPAPVAILSRQQRRQAERRATRTGAR